MLKIEGLFKKYGQRMALNNISLQVPAGSIHGLIGKNGAGKSSLLKSIMGLYKADSGTITYNDSPIYENSAIKNHICFIPEVLRYNAFDTLDSVANQHRSLYSQWCESRYQSLLDGFQLDGHKRLGRLSKGQQRQIHFCFALAAMPTLLLLDEPFDGLDPVIRHQIKNLLIQDVAERQITIVVSSHQLDTLENLCDHISLINNGEIRMSGELDALKSATHKIQLAFDKSPPHFDQTLDILYQEQQGSLQLLVVRGERNAIDQHIRAQGPKLFEFLPLSLEEMFIYEMEGLNYAHKNITL